MRRTARGIVLGVLGIGLVACLEARSEVTETFATDQASCSGSSCSCDKTCAHQCDQACSFTCAAGATCTVNCPAGGCRVQGTGSIDLRCAGGNCVLSCGGPSCILRECTGGCQVACNGAQTCSNSCVNDAKGCATTY